MPGQPGDTKVLSTLSLQGDGDVPIVRAEDIIGAIQIVNDNVQRDAIPNHVRKIGLLAYQVDVDGFFQLKGGIANTNWQPVVFSGGGSRIVDVIASPTNGQTVFNLSTSPQNPNEVVFDLNGVAYNQPAGDFNLGGAGNQTLAWLGPIIETSDGPILIRYQAA